MRPTTIRDLASGLLYRRSALDNLSGWSPVRANHVPLNAGLRLS